MASENKAVHSPELMALFGSTRGHVARYAALLPALPNAKSPFAGLPHKLIIGFTARVGSTLLCERLLPFGLYIDEFFNDVHIAASRFGAGADNYQTYCRQLVEKFAIAGRWGVKAHIQSLIPLFFVGEFPQQVASWRYVHVTRRNIVRQAISGVIASKTRSWRSSVPALRQIADDEYSADEIKQQIANIQASEARWSRFFSMFGISPLRLSYEEIAADPGQCAAMVAKHCGLQRVGEEMVMAFGKPPPEPQTSDLNAAWEARFRAGC